MNLPRENVPVRFILMCDAAANPARLELLEFFEDPGEEHPSLPLTAGLHAACFSVDDLDAVMTALGEADYGSVAEVSGQRGVSALAPGGVRFELWTA